MTTDDANLCTECGEPTLYGSRHVQCAPGYVAPKPAPAGAVEQIEDLRDEFPQNGPLGKPKVRADESLATEVRRLHLLAAHRLAAMTELKRGSRA